MEVAGRMEVHFHDQDLASVVLEISCEDERFAEVLLFCLYAARQMANLGPGPITKSLAGLLTQVPGNLTELADHDPPSGPHLVVYQGVKGRKWFSADVKGSKDGIDFKMQPHGFGVLGRGVGYYAPSSVMLLLRYLACRRLDDEPFLRGLSIATGLCGMSALAGKLTALTQVNVALECAHQVYETLGSGGEETRGAARSERIDDGTHAWIMTASSEDLEGWADDDDRVDPVTQRVLWDRLLKDMENLTYCGAESWPYNKVRTETLRLLCLGYAIGRDSAGLETVERSETPPGPAFAEKVEEIRGAFNALDAREMFLAAESGIQQAIVDAAVSRYDALDFEGKDDESAQHGINTIESIINSGMALAVAEGQVLYHLWPARA